MKKVNPAKTYLMRYRAAKSRAAALETAIREAYDAATNTTVALKEICVQTSGGGEATANAVIRMVDAEKLLSDMRAESLRDLTEISIAIGTVKDPVQQTVLIEKYINGKSLDEIKSLIGYEIRNTQIIHGRALWAVKQYLERKGMLTDE